MSEAHAADIEAALRNCASEPVHIPSSVHANGAILAVDNETLKVTHASANLEPITGISHDRVLNKSIHDVFPSGLRHDLVNVLLPDYLQQKTRLIDPFELNGRTLNASASTAKTATIFEFEPAASMRPVSGDAVKQMAFLTSQLQHVDNKQTLFEKSVRLLQVLTGYDRVMVYEFDGDGNGNVRAEALTGPLEPYLGLNFPAWDIPQQARDIMAKTPFRYITDVHASSVPVLCADSAAPPLDMTYSHLRGASPVHLLYLDNMGTKATFTLNVIVAGRLWGMISMHHPTTRMPDQNAREVCRNFVQFFGLTLDTILQRERLARLHEAEAVRRDLSRNAEGGADKAPLKDELLGRLCSAMSADGALLVKDKSIQSHGLIPPPDMLDGFIEFAAGCSETFYTSALGKDRPDLLGCVGDQIAGLHFTLMAENSFVAFFRRDRELLVNWAGAPEKTIVGQGADARLNPRGSFSAYCEAVQGSSTPWTMQECDIAGEVWSILVNAERNDLIKRTTRHQKILIDELNHRVRNLLTLIRSLSRQSASTSGTIDEFIKTLEDRIEAVADAHSLAVEKPRTYVSIRAMLQRVAHPYVDGNDRVKITGDDIGLRPDVAPIFALAVHELMTNAAKYGALSKTTGRVTIDLATSDDGLDLRIQESGGPPVKPPKREGFGTRLLYNAVPNELKAKIDLDFHKAGVRVHMTIPNSLLSTLRPVDDTIAVPGRDLVAGFAESSASAPAHALRAKKRCLLVEDSFVISMDTIQVLNGAGLKTVKTALTAKDALKAVESTPLDFAILDVNLSDGETSFNVAHSLVALGIPFIFVTGYGEQGVTSDMFPGVPVVQKPLNSRDLEQALSKVQI